MIGAMMPWAWSKSSSARSLSQYANGMDLGVLTQNGLALSTNNMWNSASSIILIIPLKTVANLPSILLRLVLGSLVLRECRLLIQVVCTTLDLVSLVTEFRVYAYMMINGNVSLLYLKQQYPK